MIPTNQLYAKKTMFALEEALKDIWQVLKARNLHKDWDQDPEIQDHITRTLIELVDTGVVDSQELRNKTLASFCFAPPH